MCYGARSGAFWPQRSPIHRVCSWRALGSILEAWRRLKCLKIGANIVPKLFHKESWNPLGDILALVCLLVPLLWAPESLLERSGEPFGQLWGTLGAVLECSGALLDPSGDHLGPSRGRFESSWGPLRGVSSALGAILASSSKPPHFFNEIQ